MLIKNHYKFGIKNSGESIEESIGNYIDSSNEYLVMGSYNFWMPNELFYKIKNVSKNVNSMVMFPHVSRSYQIINSDCVVNSLLKANVAVLISGFNHSKFLFNENNIYFGSGNLSRGGLNYNIEAVTLYDSLKGELRNDFVSIVLNEINRYLYNNGLDLRTAFSITYNYFREFSDLILKLNPNIMKVEKTVNNFEKCDLYIGKVIDMYFSLLSFKDFNTVYTELMILRLSLEELYRCGCVILHREGFLEVANPEEIQVAKENVRKYNRLWEKFNERLRNCLNTLEELITNVNVKFENDELATKNRRLILELKNKLINEFEREDEKIDLCNQCGRRLE